MWLDKTRGDNSRVAKITSDQAREIYVKYVVDKIPAKVVAAEYGVSYSLSYSLPNRIKNGVLWNEATAELRKIYGIKK